jgi:hypothetical protein
MPPCPTTNPVACDDGNAQTAQQRYPCRSVPFSPCLALIEHKADPNYDAVATRMPTTTRAAFVAHAGTLVARALRRRSPSASRPQLLSVLHTARSGPCEVGPRADPRALGGVDVAPSRTTRAAPQGTRRQARSGGEEALSRSTPRPTITVRMHSDKEPLSA